MALWRCGAVAAAQIREGRVVQTQGNLTRVIVPM
jgi:hypothetical protein